jgi:hypothetical protein
MNGRLPAMSGNYRLSANSRSAPAPVVIVAAAGLAAAELRPLIARRRRSTLRIPYTASSVGGAEAAKRLRFTCAITARSLPPTWRYLLWRSS